jgi:kynureninase
MQQYFQTWATQGVYGHFKPLAASPLPTWLDADTRASESMAPIVGALPSEVAVMETLTANLHLLMSAFYQPEIKGRHKIIIESQAFPSDHVSVVLPSFNGFVFVEDYCPVQFNMAPEQQKSLFKGL